MCLESFLGTSEQLKKTASVTPRATAALALAHGSGSFRSARRRAQARPTTIQARF
jgi:hypothetical protein